MKIGVNAVLTTDIISPILDQNGTPLMTACEGDKVYVVSCEPLMVKSARGIIFPVESNWIKTIPGRPRSVL